MSILVLHVARSATSNSRNKPSCQWFVPEAARSEKVGGVSAASQNQMGSRVFRRPPVPRPNRSRRSGPSLRTRCARVLYFAGRRSAAPRLQAATAAGSWAGFRPSISSHPAKPLSSQSLLCRTPKNSWAMRGCALKYKTLTTENVAESIAVLGSKINGKLLEVGEVKTDCGNT